MNAETQKRNPKARHGIHYAWVIALMGLLCVYASLGLGRFAYTPLLPYMKDALSLSYTDTGIIGTANFVGYLCAALIGGFLASRFGARTIAAISLSIVGAGMMLTGLADGVLSAATARALTGIGSGGSNVPVMGLPAAWFAPRRRGLAAGIFVSGSSLGLITLGFFVPALTGTSPTMGWRFCWLTLGAFVIVIAAVTFLVLRNSPREKGLRPVGAEEPPQTKPASTSQSYESQVAQRPRSLLTSRALWYLGAVYFLFGFSYIIYVQYYSGYLTKEIGMSPIKAGRLFAMIGFLSIFCGPFWGAISDLAGRRTALFLVYAFQALSFLVFALWKAYPAILLSSFLFGITAWSIPSIMAATCGDWVGPRLAPAALGMITVIFGIGQAVGPTVGGWLADLAGGKLAPAFLVACVGSALGAVGSLFLRSPEASAAQDG